VNKAADEETSDVLLDLGEYEPTHAIAEDEFVLDLDAPAYEDVTGGRESAPAHKHAFVEPQVVETVASSAAVNGFSYQPEVNAHTYSQAEEVAYEDQIHEVTAEPQETTYHVEPQPPVVEAHPVGTSVSAESLSPEMIDAIARRVVEMMSDKVVREVAWEVVPDLAELLIKKQLEEKESQHR